MKTIVFFTILLTTFSSLSLFAQPGSLDVSFSTDGKVTTDFGTNYDVGASVAIQGDGKIVLAGSTEEGFALARYNSDGTLDNNFGVSGKVITYEVGKSSKGTSMTIQNDGKIVVGGFIISGYLANKALYDFAIVRYNSNGILDNTFDFDGKVITDIGEDDRGNSIAIQSDGKIVLVGYSFNGSDKDISLIRYNSNGSLDNTFSYDGKVLTAIGNGNDEARSVAIQSNGKIVVAGYSYNGLDNDFAILRYNIDGTLDNTFDSDGSVLTAIGSSNDLANSLSIQSDGKILVAGQSYIGSVSNFALARYLSNGALDNTFESDGKVITAIGNNDSNCRSVAINKDGKIVAVGSGISINSLNTLNYDFAIVVYNVDGSLDNTFDSDGKVLTDITGKTIANYADAAYSVAIQSDGKIVVSGFSDASNLWDFAVARYNSILDPSACFFNFSVNNMVVSFTKQNSVCNSFIWDFGNGNTSTINPNPTVTFASSGVYNVCLKCNDLQSPCLNCLIVKVPSNGNGGTGITEIDNNLITISTNTFTDQIILDFNTELINAKLKIIDIQGKEIKEIVFSGQQFVIDKAEINIGMYYVQIISENKKVMNKKIIIQ
jgi:uncharacterized delta-60 repeat protein